MAEIIGKTILVVDDEPDVRLFFEVALKGAGFDVITASNGEEALDHVREQTPDLISLDLVMPKKSGIKFLYELRKNRDWKAIPVLVVTAHARDEMGKDDLENIIGNRSLSGPGVYLEKPVTAVKYINSIKTALNIEISEEEEKEIEMKEKLRRQLSAADPDKIKAMLDILKNK